MYKIVIITLSDRAFNNEYDDLSGQHLIKLFNDFELIDYKVIPDEAVKLEELINLYVDRCDLIITTGGTGLSSRDITVDVVEKLIDYEVRGVTIAMHQLSLSASKGAMFSRSLCGIKNRCMIITLPGSLKAVKEIGQLLESNIKHGIDHLKNRAIH